MISYCFNSERKSEDIMIDDSDDDHDGVLDDDDFYHNYDYNFKDDDCLSYIIEMTTIILHMIHICMQIILFITCISYIYMIMLYDILLLASEQLLSILVFQL
jgi:hypothetical protein